MKFSIKLSILFSLLFSTAFVVISYVVYISSSKTIDKQVKYRLEDQAFHTVDKIDRLFFERSADIKIVATDPVIISRNFSPKQITERLLDSQDKFKVYASLSLFDLNRIRIADTSGKMSGNKMHSNITGRTLQRAKNLPWIYMNLQQLMHRYFILCILLKTKAEPPLALWFQGCPLIIYTT